MGQILIDLPHEHRAAVLFALQGVDPKAVLVEEHSAGIVPLAPATEQLIERARAVLQGAMNPRGITSRVYICVVASLDIQACAMQLSDDEYCVAIWVGLFFRTQSAIAQIFRGNTIPVSIGLPPNKFFAPSQIDGDNYSAFQKLTLMPIPDDLGPDRERWVAGVHIALVEFVVLHELGHIANGHLGLFSEIQGVRKIVEDPQNAMSADDIVTFQTLEMDADAFAAKDLIQLWQGRGSIRSSSEQVLFDDRLVIACLGMAIAMRCFDREFYAVDQLFTEDHPPPAVRMLMIAALAITIFEMGNPGEGERAAAGYLDIVLNLEAAVIEMTGVDSKGSNIKLANHWLMEHDYLSVLFGRWAKLLPVLTQHKLGTHKLASAQRPPS